MRSAAFDMLVEILDGRWEVTEGSKFVLSGRGKIIAAQEEGSSRKQKLIIWEAKCGLTTTEDEYMDVELAGPVGLEPQWVPKRTGPPGCSQTCMYVCMYVYFGKHI